jgi:hypothetical protein
VDSNSAGNEEKLEPVSQKSSCLADENCVFAVNAYPTAECVSSNCPPPNEPQPAPFDPEYDWQEKFDSACVNAEEAGYKNVLGEELLIDVRSVKCVCKDTFCRQSGNAEDHEKEDSLQ